MNVPKFFGKVQFGVLSFDDKDALDSHLLTLEGDVEVVIRKRSTKRSMSQNHYYWGVVVRLIADETGHTPDEIHEFLKQQFLHDVITIKGEEYDTVKSTTELDTQSFGHDYVDRIRVWALTTLGVVIPDPDTIDVA